MQLEGMATCLDNPERIGAAAPGVLLDLLGVFQQLVKPPSRFIVYVDVRPNHSEDDAGIALRFRKPGQSAWYETEQQLLAGVWSPVFPLIWTIESVDIPSGRSVIDVLIDGRLAFSRLVDFGA